MKSLRSNPQPCLIQTSNRALQSSVVWEFVATTVAKCVAKDVLYFSAWWLGNLAIAITVAAISDTPLPWTELQMYVVEIILIQCGPREHSWFKLRKV